MRSRRSNIVIITFILFLVVISGGISDKAAVWPSENEALENYYELQRLYKRWEHGLFGGKKFHRRILEKYLYNLLDKEIRTDYDYYLYSPEDIKGRRVECRFEGCRWLKILGDIDGESIKDVLDKEPELLTNWWRSTHLLAVSGHLKRYRLARDPLGDTVELYFYKIKLIPHVRGLEDNKK